MAAKYTERVNSSVSRLGEKFVEVPQAGGPYYSCCACRQEENCKRNFHKNFLPNLETEQLTHSIEVLRIPNRSRSVDLPLTGVARAMFSTKRGNSLAAAAITQYKVRMLGCYQHQKRQSCFKRVWNYGHFSGPICNADEPL